MTADALVVVRPGLGAAIQDNGRPGLARFGVPPGGAMDAHALACANRLLGNPPGAAVIELLLQGARFEARRDIAVAITGADAGSNVRRWRRCIVHAGERIEFPASRQGLWTYVAVEGGFDAPRCFGSASVYPRGRIGRTLAAGDLLQRIVTDRPRLPPGESSDVEPRDYARPPAIRFWRGPQWDLFEPGDRDALVRQAWAVSSESDRVGYRLDGGRLTARLASIPSEPVLVGSIQVPPSGQPIVTMRDGPTVGGYPKIGLVDPDDLSWLAQCRPGTTVRFEPIGE